MSKVNLFSLPEQINQMDYLVATYYCEFPQDIDIVAKAASFAVGQTIGTWVPVPGVTDEMREKHMGRVVNIYDAPPRSKRKPRRQIRRQIAMRSIMMRLFLLIKQTITQSF